MFEVIASSLLDGMWEERDVRMREVAGAPAWAGSGCGERTQCWKVPSFQQAADLAEKLRSVDGVEATIREAMSPQRRRRRG